MQKHVNLSSPELVEYSLRSYRFDKSMLSHRGALTVHTGDRTGRSAKDKFIVKNDETKDKVAWSSVNQPTTQEAFDALFEKVSKYLDEHDQYVFEGYAGVRPEHAKDFRIVCELPSQAFFITQLLHASSRLREDPFEIIVAPGFKCDPSVDGTASEVAIMVDFASRRALIAGTRYSGEIKKCVFTIMNYFLPSEGILPMHCSANMAYDGSTAVFFGLSGTGKTTISADPARLLIGDDEHGWADDEVFNFEAGCYAKCIDLDPQHEPDIYNAIRFGAMMENVVLDPHTRQPIFTDASITENTRVAYPLTHIERIVTSERGEVPSTVIFLTADAFGVLPPIAKLDLDQAMYYFLSGYTSKVAGTEIGVTDPEPTFSTCFGEPFMPLDPQVYAKMLKEKVAKAGSSVYLVNTGWNGHGQRMPLAYTRAMVNAALDGSMADAEFEIDPIFGFQVPSSCPGCPSDLLDPRTSWDSLGKYEERARKLARMFQDNFEAKYANSSDEIRIAGPKL